MTRFLQVGSLILVVFCIMIACGGPSKDTEKTHKGTDAASSGDTLPAGGDGSGYGQADEETVVLGCTSVAECFYARLEQNYKSAGRFQMGIWSFTLSNSAF